MLLKTVSVDLMKYEISEAQINQLKSQFQFRFKVTAPLREPRVVVVGPPGAGRDTYSKLLSTRYGLVHVSTRELVSKEIMANTARGRRMKDRIDSGELVDDCDIIPIVTARLGQCDCKAYGWVLDGYPSTLKQINSLKLAPHLQPNICLLLECIDAKCLDRTEFKRLDPITGKWRRGE